MRALKGHAAEWGPPRARPRLRAHPPPTATLYTNTSATNSSGRQSPNTEWTQAVGMVSKLSGAACSQPGWWCGPWGTGTPTRAEPSVGPRLSVPGGHHQTARRTSPRYRNHLVVPQCSHPPSPHPRSGLPLCGPLFSFNFLKVPKFNQTGENSHPTIKILVLCTFHIPTGKDEPEILPCSIL